eukprot:TRINITY_DN51639_c0_g1_i1.p1 TRINITY_DN51639_c0_g1~~TRINITY_DN51639_c0_g1_i1.p1  ORF type:complete len:539 (+),score=75.73 TRINITY_DN51639_c0_g1_i1:26-1642(+)
MSVTVTVDVSDLVEGSMKEVPISAEGSEDVLGKVVLCQWQGKHYAVGNKCTHYGAMLKTGVFSNGHLRCPWHGACFNVATGDIEDYPGVDSLQTFEVKDAGAGKVTITADPADLKNFRRCNVKPTPAPTASDHIVIVGGGPAGAVCAETLRKEGFAGKITVFSKEGVLPYDRPKLSKAMGVAADAILLRPQQFWDDINVTFKLNTEVTHLDVTTKQLKTSAGEELTYSQAFIAPGGTPRSLPIPNFDKQNVHLLRTPQDANTINNLVEEAKTNVVIVGSSFIGMEVASCLVMKKPAKIHVIGMEEEPFQLVLGKEVGAAFRALHESKGVTFHLQRKVQEFVAEEGSNKVSCVTLDNGDKLPCDFIVVGIGIQVQTKFIEGVEKRRDGSLTVNEHCLLAKDTYAGGDVAAFPYKGGTAYVQHIGMAQYHGRIAAENMMGKQSTISNVPYFWTMQYGKSIRYCGNGFGWDEVFLSDDPASGKFTAFYGKEGAVVAVCEWCVAPQVSAAAELLQQNKMPPMAAIKELKAKDGSVDLLTLLR